MNLFNFYREKILTALEKSGAFPDATDMSRITVTAPKDPGHGDLACNAAMVLAKAAHQSPHKLVAILTPLLQELPGVAAVTAAGPGFINLKLVPQVWQDYLQVILTQGEAYGESNLGKGQIINIEFVSANPTGPMHVGHCRNAVLGDVLANTLQKVGFRVCREYYLNDVGEQIAAFARSIHLRYQEALGVAVSPEAFTPDMYRGDYLHPIAAALAKKYGDQWRDQPETTWLPLFQQEAVAAMLARAEEDLATLQVTMEVFTKESDIEASGIVEEVVSQLEAQGDAYTGILTPPKGHPLEDWEALPQLLFRSSAYGDDADRCLKKANGKWTYFAKDLGYHLDKFRRGFSQMINIWGADHAGHIKRTQAAVKAATGAHLEIHTTQLVNLFENGKPLRMSKRAGTFVQLREVVERVGKDATRFMMVSRRHDVAIDFDFAKVIEQSRDNPLFYVQYAHARACSVLRHGQQLRLDSANANPHLLTQEAELAMIRRLAEWPKELESTAMTREPHRIVNYLTEVASTFHGLWNKGKDDAQLRFIDPSTPDLSQARLGLVQALIYTIANGLLILGIEPIKEMY